MKRTKRFDEGGMASSGPQYAFSQPRLDGIGGTFNFAPTASDDAEAVPTMKKGGTVKGWGKARGARKVKIR